MAVVLLRELQQRSDAANVDRRQHHAVGRGQQVDAALGADDQAAEERLVEPVGVLERIDDREARLGAKEHRRVAVGHVQVDEERACPVRTSRAPSRR